MHTPSQAWGARQVPAIRVRIRIDTCKNRILAPIPITGWLNEYCPGVKTEPESTTQVKIPWFTCNFHWNRDNRVSV